MVRRLLAAAGNRSEQLLPWLVLLLLLTYTYMGLFYAPYLGFDFNPTNGAIQEVHNQSSLLRAGDRLHAVDTLLFADWAAALRIPLTSAVQPGDTLAVQVYRDADLVSVSWAIGPPTWAEMLARLIDIWPLGYLFWLAGLATFLSLRPRSDLQRIFAAFFFLTAIWIVTGNLSRRILWDVAVLFRVAIWLSLPVYLHLHWSFPRPLRPLPHWVFPMLYLLGTSAALLQWFELLPKQAYALGFLLALLGSLIFLLLHVAHRPEDRRQLAVILYSFLFALAPSALLSIFAALQNAPRLGGIALLALPVLPAGYFYAIYRHRSDSIQIRANRLMTLFFYLIAMGSGVIGLSILFAALLPFPGQELMATLVISLSAVLLTLKGYPRFARWIEIHMLGMPHSPEALLESYLTRITTSLSRTGLAHLLRDEVLPSLLIRQSALLLDRSAAGNILYTQGVEEDRLRHLSLQSDRAAQSQGVSPYPREVMDDLPVWVRLSIPLRFGKRLLGLWLLGRHDPDDLYAERTIAILHNIAQQTAIALVNIEQAEQLQMFYQADIQRHEEERGRLARTLHDEILNQAAIAYNSLGASALSERFEREYELLKEQIRRMISDLRPSSLRWGLHIALEELADTLSERGNGSPTVEFSIPYSDERYPEQNEDQIYRIVQQACENAFRHSRASHIQIAGLLLLNRVEIQVIDDGIGFDTDKMSLSDLLERKQYGLVGMYERAKLIGAELAVESQIDNGTTVHLRWLNATIINPTIF